MGNDFLDLEDCLLDSPPYRQKLAQCDTHLTRVEQCLREVFKSARCVIETSHQLSEQSKTFSENLVELGRIEANRPTEQTFVPFFGTSNLECWSSGQHIMFLAEEMKRIESVRRDLALQLETIFLDPLELLARNELTATKELKKRWEKQGNDFLHENSKFMARKIPEGANELADVRKAYHQTSLEYVTRLNEVLGREKVRISEAVLAFCQSRIALSEKERLIFKDIEPNLKYLEQTASTDRAKLFIDNEERLRKKETIASSSANIYNPMSAINTPTITAADSSKEPTMYQNNEIVATKNGYLYKKSSHSMRPVWSRRYFSLHDNVLEYYTLEAKNNAITIMIDLRLCSVKVLGEGFERRNCFEIVSPVKTYTLQAENEFDQEEWIRAIQKSIHAAINESSNRNSIGQIKMADSTSQELLASYLPGTTIEAALSAETRKEIQAIAGNDQCADCGAADPEWASLSFGILMCIQCSGIHRSLGVHISKVRSTKLDHWESEHVKLMKGLGNEKSNEIFEASYSGSDVSFYKKPSHDSTHEDKEHWIIAKYDLKKFLTNDITQDLNESIINGEISQVLGWLASGYDPDTIIDTATGSTALFVAIRNEQWAIAALLLIWSAKINVKDNQGQTILHLLAVSTSFSLTFLTCLLRRSVDLMTVDSSGKDPMQLAIDHGNGDFVTILRMFMHDQDHQRRLGMHRSSLTCSDKDTSKAEMLTINDDGGGVTDNSDVGGGGGMICEHDDKNSNSNRIRGSRTEKPNGKGSATRRTFKKLLRHYPKFYQKLTFDQSATANNNNSRRRHSMEGLQDGASTSGTSSTQHRPSLTKSMANLNPFGKKSRKHKRSSSVSEKRTSSSFPTDQHEAKDQPTSANFDNVASD